MLVRGDIYIYIYSLKLGTEASFYLFTSGLKKETNYICVPKREGETLSKQQCGWSATFHIPVLFLPQKCAGTHSIISHFQMDP